MDNKQFTILAEELHDERYEHAMCMNILEDLDDIIGSMCTASDSNSGLSDVDMVDILGALARCAHRAISRSYNLTPSNDMKIKISNMMSDIE